MDFTGAFGPSHLFKDKALSSPSLHADHTEIISWSLDWPKLFNQPSWGYQLSNQWFYMTLKFILLRIRGIWLSNCGHSSCLFLIQEPSIRFSCNQIYIYIFHSTKSGKRPFANHTNIIRFQKSAYEVVLACVAESCVISPRMTETSTPDHGENAQQSWVCLAQQWWVCFRPQL